MRIRSGFEEIFFGCCSNLSNEDNFLEARSENVCEKWHFLVRSRVRIWRTGRHTPTKNFQEKTPGLDKTNLKNGKISTRYK